MVSESSLTERTSLLFHLQEFIIYNDFRSVIIFSNKYDYFDIR